MSFQEAFFAAPPITRVITAATVAISVPGHLGFYSLAWVFFLKDYIFTLRQLPQLWRLVTGFFITGAKLGLIMDPFFLYQYSSQLETSNPRFSVPGAYAWYLFFVSCIIMLTGGIYLGGLSLLSPLSLALIYTYSLEDPNRQVSFFIVQMPAKYLPVASLAITFVMAGPGMTMVQATGLLAAHAYEFFDRIWPEYGNGPHLIKVPRLVQNLFASEDGSQRRAYGTSFAGRPSGPAAQTIPQNQTDRGGSWASGSGWNSRGTGRRLGGE